MSWIMIRPARQKDALIEDVEFVDAVAKVKIYLAEDQGLMKTGEPWARGTTERSRFSHVCLFSEHH